MLWINIISLSVSVCVYVAMLEHNKINTKS